MISIDEVINKFIMQLIGYTDDQIVQLKNCLFIALNGYDIIKQETALIPSDTDENLKVFQTYLMAKKVEGCTNRTLSYYKNELRQFLSQTNKPIIDITTNDIRYYIAIKATRDKNSKVTQDNTLRIIRSFMSWLTAEEYIQKNPCLKIKKIRAEKHIKKPFSEIEIEKLRLQAKSKRELAMIDVLLSTGIRVAELCSINRNDIDGDQIIVYGKGEKERYVYLNAKAIVSIDEYLKTRTDNNQALFVTDFKPNNRLKISGAEIAMRELGSRSGISNVHPHRFRRTAATLALNRGMPIDQVQKMLGHSQINTTLIYAQSAQESLKASHKKYLT